MSFHYDPSAPAIIEDPYPAYTELRENYPLYFLARYGIWVVSRFEDIRAIARDRDRFSTAGGVDLDLFGYTLIGEGNFLEMDPPRHDVLRAMVRSRFSPRNVVGLEATVREHCLDLLAPLRGRGEADLAKDFALMLPMRVICDLLGIAHEDHAMLCELFLAMTTRSPGDPAIPASAHEAAVEMRAYLADAATARKTSPSDDLMSDIVQATIDGEHLTGDEIVGVCLLLFMAGVGTTASLVSNALLVLDQHRDQRALVQLAAEHSNTAQLQAAIEELLRFETPVQLQMRTCRADVALHGTTVPAGARIALLYGSANRDPRQFDQPDVLDIQRKQQRHLAFGEGLHFCLGNVLARLEGRISLDCVLSTLPRYTLCGPVERSALVGERGILTLPVAC